MALLPIGQTQQTQGTESNILDRAMDLFNPRTSLLEKAGVLLGGASGKKKGPFDIGFNILGSTAGPTDWRVRISLANSADYFYSSTDRGILAPLFKGSNNHNGVVFPYTPQVQVQHTARYANQKLTHSNYDAFFYEGSEVQAITVSGEFTVQNLQEGRYLLAALYFFRASTKMWFGQGSRAGNPPPVVFLDGYGTHYFPHVPCVVTNFSHIMPQEVDYIEIPAVTGTSSTRLPTSSQVSVTLQPIYSRKSLHDKFNLDEFAKGNLINGGFI
jgi:hypothetical protein